MECRNEGPAQDWPPLDATASRRREARDLAIDTTRTCAAAATVSVSGSQEGDDGLWERTRQIDLLSTATFATVGLAVMGLWIWHVIDPQAIPRATPTPPRDPPAVARVVQPSRPAPVTFVNPFDPTEVFHLPPGTTEDAARAVVAAQLLERGRTRIADGTMFRAAAGREAKQFAAR